MVEWCEAETLDVWLTLSGGPGCSSFTGMLVHLARLLGSDARRWSSARAMSFAPATTRPSRSSTTRGRGRATRRCSCPSRDASEALTLRSLDQPSGVGFSYTDRGDKGVWSTEQAAVDVRSISAARLTRQVHAFVSIWFEAFSGKFGNAPFHISGESYAGRYIVRARIAHWH